MLTIYVDTLFLLETLLHTTALLVVNALNMKAVRKRRILVWTTVMGAAGIGIWALHVPVIFKIMLNLLCEVGGCFGTFAGALGIKKTGNILRILIQYFGSICLCAGVLEGIRTFTMTIPNILFWIFSTVLCFGIAQGSEFVQNYRWKGENVNCVLTVAQDELCFTALIDGGNGLTDTAGNPVCVISAELLPYLSPGKEKIRGKTAGGDIEGNVYYLKNLTVQRKGIRKRCGRLHVWVSQDKYFGREECKLLLHPMFLRGQR